MLEFLLVLYLISGPIKSFASIGLISFPCDLTLLTASFLMVFFLHNQIDYSKQSFCYNRGSIIWYALLIFWLWMIISLVYTSSNNYSLSKTFSFITNLIPFLVISFSTTFSIKRFLLLFLVANVVVSCLFIPLYSTFRVASVTEEIRSFMGLYLSLGTNIGLIIVLLLSTTEKMLHDKWKMMMIMLLWALLIILGARGPLMFAFIVMLGIMYKDYQSFIQFLKKNILYVFLVLMFCIGIAYYIELKTGGMISLLFDFSIERLSLILDGLFSSDNDMGDSANTRVELIYFSIAHIFSSVFVFLFGTGIGSFGYEWTGVDMRLYPHNIILEILFELGFIGLLIFGYILYILWKNYSLYRKKYVSGFVLFYIFLNLMKSNCLEDLRVYFSFIAIYILFQNRKSKDLFQYSTK